MRALIRQLFPYGGREMIVGTVEEIDDAAFARFKRDRLVTEAPTPLEVSTASVVEAAWPQEPDVAIKPQSKPPVAARKPPAAPRRHK